MAVESKYQVSWTNEFGVERLGGHYKTRKEAEDSVTRHVEWLLKLGYKDIPVYKITRVERAVVRRKRARQAVEGDGEGDLRSLWMPKERSDREG